MKLFKYKTFRFALFVALSILVGLCLLNITEGLTTTPLAKKTTTTPLAKKTIVRDSCKNTPGFNKFSQGTCILSSGIIKPKCPSGETLSGNACHGGGVAKCPKINGVQTYNSTITSVGCGIEPDPCPINYTPIDIESNCKEI